MQKEPGPWSTEGGDVHFRTVMIFFFFLLCSYTLANLGGLFPISLKIYVPTKRIGNKYVNLGSTLN